LTVHVFPLLAGGAGGEPQGDELGAAAAKLEKAAAIAVNEKINCICLEKKYGETCEIPVS